MLRAPEESLTDMSMASVTAARQPGLLVCSLACINNGLHQPAEDRLAPVQVLEAARQWSVGDQVEVFREGWWAGDVTDAAGCMATVTLPSSGEALCLPAELVRLRYCWAPNGSWSPMPAAGGFPLHLTGVF